MSTGASPQVGNSSPTSLSTLGNDASSAFGLAGGLIRGGTLGDLSAASSATRLAAGSNLLPSSVAPGASVASSGLGDVLGIYQGIQSGGIVGDTSAGVNAAKLATLGASQSGLIGSQLAQSISTDLGYVAAPLALYEFGKNWQSGATGSDALGGASAGAAIGSIVPGIGTAIGAVIGAAVGAVSSAFGGGKKDPETIMSQNANAAGAGVLAGQSPSTSFQYLAGIFDAKNNTAGHSDPLEQVFGRMGEGNFTSQMASQINSAFQAGKIPAGASPQQIYQTVVLPWLNAQGANMSMNRTDAKGNNYNANLVDSIQNLIGAYTSGQLTSSTPVGISGQQISNLPAFAGLGASTGIQTNGQAAANQVGGLQPTQPIQAIQHGPSTQTVLPGFNGAR